jgi:RsiW-degrading membrane proteinase PrsW (M82 family)
LALFSHPRYDRLLLGSPLRRPGYAVVIIVVLALLLMAASAVFGLTVWSMRSDTLRVFLTSLAGSTALSVVPLGFLWWLDRRERESPWLFAVAFLWGGVIATGLALPINSAILAGVAEWVSHNPAVTQTLGPEAALMLGAPLAGPLVEEVTKGLGVVALFLLLRAEFDNMRDGFIYGALVGAGFNWFEAPLYVAQGYAEFGTAPYGLHLGARFALFGLAGHALFTGLFGAFLGLARQATGWWIRYSVPIIGLLLAIVAHALNNLLPLVVALAGARAGKAPPTASLPPPDLGIVDAWTSASAMNLVVFFPFVALVAFLLWRSGLWERSVIRDELAEEVGDTVTLEEYEQIERDGMFRSRRIDRMERARSAALVKAQHELAFRKRRVRDGRGNPERDPLVAGWRREIRQLRT